MMKKSITDRLKSYEDACEILGITPLTPDQFSFLPEGDRQAFYSLHRITTAITAINEGHQFDWNNWGEGKYYPWWDMETYDDDPAGSGFSYDGYGSARAGTAVGARLCTRSEEHAKYIADLFFEDYRNWIKK